MAESAFLKMKIIIITQLEAEGYALIVKVDTTIEFFASYLLCSYIIRKYICCLWLKKKKNFKKHSLL